MKITPYKRRKLRFFVETWVYRNLSRPGVIYSVVQDGRVVAHAEEISLMNVRFVVREAGRQRVLREHRKNVHAFVVGILIQNESFQRNGLSARYNPYHSGSFIMAHGGDGTGNQITKAYAAHLGPTGLQVWDAK